jgi:hypothetical protein
MAGGALSLIDTNARSANGGNGDKILKEEGKKEQTDEDVCVNDSIEYRCLIE